MAVTVTPQHPDDPDHRELTRGYVGSGPLATGALILNDALGSGTLALMT